MRQSSLAELLKPVTHDPSIYFLLQFMHWSFWCPEELLANVDALEDERAKNK